MTTSNPRYGDVGHAFRRILIDKDGNPVTQISTATEVWFIFTKPDGTDIYRVGELATDGTDGVVEYVTEGTWDLDSEPHTFVGDLDQVGHWQGCVRIVYASGTFTTSTFHFQVDPNLDTADSAYPEE